MLLRGGGGGGGAGRGGGWGVGALNKTTQNNMKLLPNFKSWSYFCFKLKITQNNTK